METNNGTSTPPWVGQSINSDQPQSDQAPENRNDASKKQSLARYFNVFTIFLAVLILQGIGTAPLVSIDFLQNNPSSGFSAMYITALGTRNGNTAISGLVNSGSGFGSYLVIGTVILIIVLIAELITAKEWIANVALCLAVGLVFLSEANRRTVTDIIVHVTGANDVAVSPFHDNTTDQYGLIVLYLLITRIPWDIVKNPKRNSRKLQ